MCVFNRQGQRAGPCGRTFPPFLYLVCTCTVTKNIHRDDPGPTETIMYVRICQGIPTFEIAQRKRARQPKFCGGTSIQEPHVLSTMVPSIATPGTMNTPLEHTPRTSSTDRFDFHVIDAVYGRNSDLYQDVLGVSPRASRKEIRAAFVDSRDEFFQFQTRVEGGELVVTQGQLDFAKRRMDAVVAAFRILHDPNLRAFYDEARDHRMQQPQHSSSSERNKDPVVQAVSRALGESPTRSKASVGGGKSPFESSSGGDTPTSSIVILEKKSTDTSLPNRLLRTALGASSSSKRTKATTTAPTPSTPTNYYTMNDKAAAASHSRRNFVDPSSLLVSDDGDSSTNDFDSSKQYKRERKRSHDTATTTASSEQSLDEDDLDEHTYTQQQHVQGWRQFSPRRRRTVAPTIDDVSTAISYYNDDDTIVGVDDDLTTLCCHGGLRERTTVMSKTRALLLAVRTEIRGSIKDTTSAFDQVCNAFTLQEKDIQAVTSKIDKASRQLRG